MAYGSALVDTIQSSTTGTPPQFNDGSGTQIGTLCRAWVNFAGATGAINASFNVSSVTRTATGTYTISFATTMPDAKYCTQIGSGATTTSVSYGYYGTNTVSASSLVINIASTTGSLADLPATSVAVFR